MITIRCARAEDLGQLADLRTALWPEGSREEHESELRSWFAGQFALETTVLAAVTSEGLLIGFTEVSIRPHAEGCRTDRVGYLEGWFVEEGFRRRGIGRLLLEASEKWARLNGCREFASDTTLDNRASIAAHRAGGFEDAGVIHCFRKDL